MAFALELWERAVSGPATSAGKPKGASCEAPRGCVGGSLSAATKCAPFRVAPGSGVCRAACADLPSFAIAGWYPGPCDPFGGFPRLALRPCAAGIGPEAVARVCACELPCGAAPADRPVPCGTHPVGRGVGAGTPRFGPWAASRLVSLAARWPFPRLQWPSDHPASNAANFMGGWGACTASYGEYR